MQLEKAERKIFLDDLGVSGSGLESLVSSALLLQPLTQYVTFNVHRFELHMTSWDCKHTLLLAKKRPEHGPSRFVLLLTSVKAYTKKIQISVDILLPKPRELFTQISNVASLSTRRPFSSFFITLIFM